jgi:hypothetical protein
MNPENNRKMPLLRRSLACIFVLVTLAGCGGGQSRGSAAAVEAYLEALVTKDANAVANLTCAAWEADAQVEYDSFAAVTARLEDLACEESGQNNNFTLVSCTGKIVANYNGEDQEILLADRVYQAVEEGGDWRMCGYAGSR